MIQCLFIGALQFVYTVQYIHNSIADRMFDPAGRPSGNRLAHERLVLSHRMCAATREAALRTERTMLVSQDALNDETDDH